MKLVRQTAAEAQGATLLHAISLQGSPALVLDCIKRGEDDDDVSRGELPKRMGRSIILRIYDSLGGTATGLIKWDSKHLAVKKVFKTNVLEDDEGEVVMQSAGVPIKLRPFEVATFRLQL